MPMSTPQPPLPDAAAIAVLLQLGQAALAASIPSLWRSSGGFPSPRYPAALEAFFLAASEPPWSAPDYAPADCAQQVRAADGFAAADLATLRRLLTWMVRGERFCDGHWGAMLSAGHLRRWLQRLAQLA